MWTPALGRLGEKGVRNLGLLDLFRKTKKISEDTMKNNHTSTIDKISIEESLNNNLNENILTVYNLVKEICHIYKKDKSPGAYSFEGTEVHITIVEKNEKLFMRSSTFKTTSEGNGRPITDYSDILYPIDSVSEVNETNWKDIERSKFLNRIELSYRSFEGVNSRLLLN